MERVFLDANVLFSASYRPGAGVARLWLVPDARLLTSRYALGEALRNLDRDDQRRRLAARMRRVETVRLSRRARLPVAALALPPKDRPILAAAIACRAHYLLTGDRKHFGRFFGRRVGGVLIIPPAEYPRLHP